MRRAATGLLLAFLLAACRTTGPAGPPFPPLTATNAQDAWRELLARADQFTGARSLVRMRVTSRGETRSFRAQLAVYDRQKMQLIVYTPVGTTAATISTDGNRVTVHSTGGDDYEGDASQLLASYGLYTGGLTPAELGMLIIGLPPRPDLAADTAAAGLASVRLAETTVTYEPPAFPAQKVSVEHGGDRAEIENLEVVALR